MTGNEIIEPVDKYALCIDISTDDRVTKGGILLPTNTNVKVNRYKVVSVNKKEEWLKNEDIILCNKSLALDTELFHSSNEKMFLIPIERILGRIIPS